MLIISMFWTTISYKNNITPSIINATRLYVIDDLMKIKQATKWRETINQ